MKRVMCVYLPQWPLQRLLHERPDLRSKPLAIAAGPAGRARILWCCARSIRAGVRPGMTVAEGRATEPLLSVHEEDSSADIRALRKLAAWAERYSPTVGVEDDPHPECLLLDITGCGPYFHGEERLVERTRAEFTKEGWKAQVAVGDTVGAVWGLAHHAENGCIAPAGQTEKALLPLPVAALRLPQDAQDHLAELGIESISQLMELPRADLPGRFGALVVERLDQALGHLREPIVPCHFRPDVQVRCSFEYPTDRREVLLLAIDQLLERLVEMLRERHRGAKHLECWFCHEAVPPVRIDVQLFRPSRSTTHLGKLLRTRLEHIRMDEPVAGIRVRVPVVEVMPERQFELFDAEEPGTEEFSALIDRLVGRLGREAVTFASLVPDPQPEYACRFEPALTFGRGSPNRAVLPTTANRPVQVWPMPEAIDVFAPRGVPVSVRRKGCDYAVKHWWGPERIATGWWRGRDIERDYYMIETAAGTRWWIFRRRDDGCWFLHGCFD